MLGAPEKVAYNFKTLEQGERKTILSSIAIIKIHRKIPE